MQYYPTKRAHQECANDTIMNTVFSFEAYFKIYETFLKASCVSVIRSPNTYKVSQYQRGNSAEYV